MNIKLKAALIATCIPVIIAFATVTIIQFPVILVAAMLGGALYWLYRVVLNILEQHDFGKKKVK